MLAQVELLEGCVDLQEELWDGRGGGRWREKEEGGGGGGGGGGTGLKKEGWREAVFNQSRNRVP